MAKYSQHPNWMQGIAVALLSTVVLAVIQFATPDLAGRDGYYHIKLASLMAKDGLLQPFPWLPNTVLNAAEYVDHHFLFHVLLIPFTFGSLITGAKIASIVFAASVVVALWWLLQNEGLKHASLWALGALTLSDAFLFRMSMPRAHSLSLLLLILALHFLLRKNYRALFPLGFAFVWLYDAFPLLLVVAAIYAFTFWLHSGRIAWQPAAWTGAGITAGLILNPYFPRNLVFIARHILPKLADATSTSVGSEWYPYTTSQLLENSWPALALLVVALFAIGWAAKRVSMRTTLAFLSVLAFGFLLLQARRFIEYFPPMALIFAAFALNDFKLPRLSKRFSRTLAFAAVFGIAVTALTTIGRARAAMATSEPFERYAGAAAWLAQTTPVNSLVFTSDWDDFPELFFHNHHNVYLVGLDPTYMQLHDPELYDLWVSMTQGDINGIGWLIRDVFRARYVFSDLDHRDFLARATTDPAMREVYRDEYAVVYEVID